MRPPAPWSIVEVDLDRPTPAITAPEGANGVLVVFRRHGVVLGLKRLLPDNLPLTELETAAIAAYATARTARSLIGADGRPEPAPGPRAGGPGSTARLEGSEPVIDRLDRTIANRKARPISVTASVVVCARRGADDLATCLNAVARANTAGHEVLVVDCGADPERKRIAHSFGDVDYVPASTPGRARNAGLAAARGDVVAFIDDHVRPEPGWTGPLLQGFCTGTTTVVCGLVLPQELATEAQIGFESEFGFGPMDLRPLSYDAAFAQAWTGGVPVWKIGAGANMAVRRKRALEIGGFDERLGHGAGVGSGDVAEFFRRVLAAGDGIVYEPFSLVRQCSRRGWDALVAATRAYAEGQAAALFAQYAAVGDRGDLWRALFGIPLQMLGRTAKAPLQRLRGEPDRLLWPLMRGYLDGLGRVGLARTAGKRSLRQPTLPKRVDVTDSLAQTLRKR